MEFLSLVEGPIGAVVMLFFALSGIIISIVFSRRCKNIPFTCAAILGSVACASPFLVTAVEFNSDSSFESARIVFLILIGGAIILGVVGAMQCKRGSWIAPTAFVFSAIVFLLRGYVAIICNFR